ncbi:MAG: CaiB/BaiF CoA transferase family protein [Crocinitomicaceae bacterium]
MFEDLLVVDLSTVLAGPSVATFFAELGAKVIKVENKKGYDVTRSWKLPNENKESIISAYFSSVNYKKQYIQLNLRTEEDHQDFLQLIKVADILIMNFKHGDQEKLGLEESVLRKCNPGLIIGKISGFGKESDRVAYDLILQAETGFMSMNGTSESGPVKMPVAMIDVLAAHQLKEGILVAMLKLKESGKATTVTVSLYDAAVSSLVNQASNYLMQQHIPERIGSLHPNIAPYGEIFTTKDNAQITFAIGSNTHFEKLCDYLQLEDLKTDIRFSDNQSRVINRLLLQGKLQERIAEINADDVLKVMHNEHVPTGKIKDLKEVFENPTAQRLVREEQIYNVQTKRVTSIAFELS